MANYNKINNLQCTRIATNHEVGGSNPSGRAKLQRPTVLVGFFVSSLKTLHIAQLGNPATAKKPWAETKREMGKITKILNSMKLYWLY